MEDEMARRYVAMTYKSILRRDPTSDEVNHYTDKIKEGYFKNSLEYISTFATSEEAKVLCNRDGVLSCDDLRISTEFHNRRVFSLGSHCATSFLLKSFNMKRESGPFDWIFSSLDMVSDCIEDDFESLLDKRLYYRKRSEDDHSLASGVAGHHLFEQKYNLSTIFNHYDPLSVEKYHYLSRCVSRLRLSLYSDNISIFFAIVRVESSADAKSSVVRLRHVLSKIKHNFRLCVVEVTKPQPVSEGAFSLKLMHSAYNTKLFHMTPVSELGSVSFENAADNAIFGRLAKDIITST